LQHPQNGLRDGFDCEIFRHQTDRFVCLATQRIAGATDRRADNRQTGRHRFEHRTGHSLEVRADHETVEQAQDVADVIAVTEQVQACAHAEALGSALECGSL
jgi:hypothetical protein